MLGRSALVTLALVEHFLNAHGLSETRDALRREAEDMLHEVEAHRISVENDIPLEAIVSEHEAQKLSRQMKHLSIQDRDWEETLAAVTAPPITTLKDVLPTNHSGNVTTVIQVDLPKSLFPASYNDLSTPTFTALISAGSDKFVIVSDAESNRVLANICIFQAPVLCLKLYPSALVDGRRYLFTGSMDGHLRLVDLSTSDLVASWHDHKKYVLCLDVSDDGEWIATSSNDRSICIYRRKVDDESEHPAFELVHSHTYGGAVESMCILKPDPSLVFTNYTVILGVRGDHRLVAIDLSPSSEPPFPVTSYNMNENGDNHVSFTPMFLAPSPDHKHLACFTDSDHGRLIVFRARSSVQVRNCWGMPWDRYLQPRCCWDSSGRFLYCNSDDRSIWVFDLKVPTATDGTSPSAVCVEKLKGHTEGVRHLSFNAESDQMISAGLDKSIRIWKRPSIMLT
ncbi:WD40-repeat-containing domain protein [Cladochytrium replicatum]|nr:WD40-repeat-containing domain protein [Cladochytrium replicatum]